MVRRVAKSADSGGSDYPAQVRTSCLRGDTTDSAPSSPHLGGSGGISPLDSSKEISIAPSVTYGHPTIKDQLACVRQ